MVSKHNSVCGTRVRHFGGVGVRGGGHHRIVLSTDGILGSKALHFVKVVDTGSVFQTRKLIELSRQLKKPENGLCGVCSDWTEVDSEEKRLREESH